MADSVIRGVTVVPGGGRPRIPAATVVIGADGVVRDIVAEGLPSNLMLVPGAVDLHLDNLRERRRPRATVNLDVRGVLVSLDAECAAGGIAVVCVAARCEHAPGKGVLLEDAINLAATLEYLAPELACDWRLHARVEVTEDAAVDALADVLDASSRVALISVMEHSLERHRFESADAHRRFYAEDWGVSVDQVDEIMAAKGEDSAVRDDRRRAVATIAAEAGIPLASHDDRSVDDVDAAAALGARISEFPLSTQAAARAREHGMAVVLGAPNAVRGRSTSPGNLLVADAVGAGLCDVLCSDYLPTALQEAPHALAASGVLSLDDAIDLVAARPAAAIGIDRPAIEVGQPLTASLRLVSPAVHVGLALWRGGRLVFCRSHELVDRVLPALADA
jgi:alpha-D-ribose 1-methylphosphonate 5-triphosphate diphosphatase